MGTGVVQQRWFALVALVLLAGACVTTPTGETPTQRRAPVHPTALQLTREGADRTLLSASDGRVRADAPLTNLGSNSRSVVRDPSSERALDEGACATVTHSGLPVQEGIALRVTTDRGRTRAITVTKNIWADLSWVYNVHVWDTALVQPFVQLGSFDMSAALRPDPDAAAPRLCARVVGDRVELKVWTSTDPEPAWGDPRSTREVQLAPEWVHAGETGWYIGHLPPGGWAEFRELAAWTAPDARD